MDIFIWVIIITAAAGMAGTGFGGAAGAFFGGNSKRMISLLLSFAGGVMTAVVCFELLPEAIASSDLVTVITGVLFGFTVTYLLNDIIDRAAMIRIRRFNGTVKYKEGSGARLLTGGIVMAAAIALHNLPEGMVIGASYSGSTVPINSESLAVAAVIGLHNIPEGMAISVPLIAGGMKKLPATAITVAAGIPTVFGAVIGYMLGTLNDLWTALSLSFASGAMLYVVFGELLPDSAFMWRSKLPVFAAILGIVIGLLMVS